MKTFTPSPQLPYRTAELVCTQLSNIVRSLVGSFYRRSCCFSSDCIECIYLLTSYRCDVSLMMKWKRNTFLLHLFDGSIDDQSHLLDKLIKILFEILSLKWRLQFVVICIQCFVHTRRNTARKFFWQTFLCSSKINLSEEIFTISSVEHFQHFILIFLAQICI